jgi:beta-galactosidase
VPQDCGNMEGAYRVKLDAAFDSVTFETRSKPFVFEVNPYAPETLTKHAHPAELPQNDSTFFGIYAKSRGLGGNSCGPIPLARDIIKDEPFTLEFSIR